MSGPDACERICILCEQPVAGDVEVRQALPGIPVKEDAAGMMHKDTGLAGAERQALVEALERFGYNRARTAAYLEIDKSTLWRKMKKYNLLDETKRNK